MAGYEPGWMEGHGFWVKYKEGWTGLVIGPRRFWVLGFIRIRLNRFW